MTFDPQEVLRRFHRALLREIRAANPEYLHSPFSVAEIYQNLVPYRTHRDELGVEMNADYEHALLRLLAGEGDYLNRDFAAADVRLNPEKVDDGLGGEGSGPAEAEEAARDEPDIFEEKAEEPVPETEHTEVQDDAAVLLLSDDGAFSGSGADEAERVSSADVVTSDKPDDEVEAKPEEVPEEMPEVVAEAVPEEVPEETPAAVSDAGAEEDAVEDAVEEAEKEGKDSDIFTPDVCPWCRGSLPERDGMKFCPFCGSNVQRRPCPECGEELELKWQFCIACGTEVTS
jgi:hypothetical protein